MRSRFATAICGGILSATVALAATSSEPIIYPTKGQTKDKQAKDTSECSSWATQQTGISPEKLLQQSQQAGAAPQGTTGQGAVGGAARGAAVGAIGGAIGGDAGKGAAIGAGVGGAAGAGRKHRQQKQAQAETEQQKAGIDAQLATYRKAQTACLEGKGYSVK